MRESVLQIVRDGGGALVSCFCLFDSGWFATAVHTLASDLADKAYVDWGVVAAVVYGLPRSSMALPVVTHGAATRRSGRAGSRQEVGRWAMAVGSVPGHGASCSLL